MASLEKNLETWQSYDWPAAGDEWSTPWGGPAMQWCGTLLPRLNRFLPAPVILEIAPGFGRWTTFLKNHCDRLIGVDLTERCVDHCRQRFRDFGHVEFHVNDGKSLPMADAGSVDLAFSFDSLVHVEADVMDAYAGELRRVLGRDGVAFLHHSNQGAYPEEENMASRARSMTAERFRGMAQEHDLSVVSQELIDWVGSENLIDCISVLTVPGSRWEQEPKLVENRHFMEEAARLRAAIVAARLAYERSKSWRLTAPLRRISAVARRLR